MVQSVVKLAVVTVRLRCKKSINPLRLRRMLAKYGLPPDIIDAACRHKPVDFVILGWSPRVSTQFSARFHQLADWEITT
jgi:hypothetical protein